MKIISQNYSGLSCASSARHTTNMNDACLNNQKETYFTSSSYLKASVNICAVSE